MKKKKKKDKDLTYSKYISSGISYLRITIFWLVGIILSFTFDFSISFKIFYIAMMLTTWGLSFYMPIGEYHKFAYWDNFTEDKNLKIMTAVIYFPMFLSWKTYKAIKHAKSRLIEYFKDNKQRKIDARNPYFEDIKATLRVLERLHTIEDSVKGTENEIDVAMLISSAEDHLSQLRSELPVLEASNASREDLDDITQQLSQLRERHALVKKARTEIDELVNPTI